MGPAEAPLAPTRGARVRFPHWDGERAGVRGVLTSLKLGASEAEETTLALASTLGWGSLIGDPERWAGRGEGLAPEIALAWILILPVLPLHCQERRVGRHGGAQPQLCTDGCEAIGE